MKKEKRRPFMDLRHQTLFPDEPHVDGRGPDA